MPAFLFCGEFERSRRSAGSGAVAAEDAEFAGGGADCGESLIEASDIAGFDVDKKLVFPGAAVNGAAFDFEQIHTVSCEWLERGKERTRTVSEAHGQRNFAGVGREPGSRLFFRNEQNETGEIFGIVLNALGENYAVVVLGGATSGDCGAGFISAGESFADTTGGVFGGNALPLGMRGKEALALREGHGM